MTTCTAQGFILTLFVSGGLNYNASLNLYYLIVIKYEKSAEYIRTKIEPALHINPIVVTLTYSIFLLVGNHYNSANWMPLCTLPYHYPPHCIGYDVGETPPGFDIPCGQGMEGAIAVDVTRLVLMSVLTTTIFISLGVIYRTVRKQEQKLARYAPRSSIEVDANQHSGSSSSSLLGKLRRSLSKRPSSTTTAVPPISIRSNDTQSRSRAVMHKAFGYSFAWLLSYGIYTVYLVMYLFYQYPPIVLDYIWMIFLPLQGFFNLAIYMLPKVVHAKKQGRGKHISWSQAIRKAFWSKGSARTTTRGSNGGRTNSRGSRSSSHLRRPRPLRNSHTRDTNRTTTTSAATTTTYSTGSTTQLTSPNQRLGEMRKMKIKTPTKQRRGEEEEEKCEMQAPHNMMPTNHRASLVTVAPNQGGATTNSSPPTTTKIVNLENPSMAEELDNNRNQGGENEHEDEESSTTFAHSPDVDGNDANKNEGEMIVEDDKEEK